MTRIYQLDADEEQEEHLWTSHRLYVDDAYDVLDEGRYKVFRDKGYADRVKMIGPTAGGRMLTFIITLPDGQGVARLITGWPSDNEEIELWRKPGGRQHA